MFVTEQSKESRGSYDLGLVHLDDAALFSCHKDHAKVLVVTEYSYVHNCIFPRFMQEYLPSWILERRFILGMEIFMIMWTGGKQWTTQSLCSAMIFELHVGKHREANVPRRNCAAAVLQRYTDVQFWPRLQEEAVELEGKGRLDRAIEKLNAFFPLPRICRRLWSLKCSLLAAARSIRAAFKMRWYLFRLRVQKAADKDHFLGTVRKGPPLRFVLHRLYSCQFPLVQHLLVEGTRARRAGICRERAPEDVWECHFIYTLSDFEQ